MRHQLARSLNSQRFRYCDFDVLGMSKEDPIITVDESPERSKASAPLRPDSAKPKAIQGTADLPGGTRFAEYPERSWWNTLAKVPELRHQTGARKNQPANN